MPLVNTLFKIIAVWLVCGYAYSADYSTEGVEIAFFAEKEGEMVVRGDVDMPFAEDESRFSARSNSSVIVYRTVMLLSAKPEGVEARFTDCASGAHEVIVFRKEKQEEVEYLIAEFQNGTRLVWHLPAADRR